MSDAAAAAEGIPTASPLIASVATSVRLPCEHRPASDAGSVSFPDQQDSPLMHDVFDDDPLLSVEAVFDLKEFPGLTVTPNVARDVPPGIYRARIVADGAAHDEARVKLEWVHFNPTGF
jgi:hypothetical protein